jgi:hypothetical protein
MRSFEPLSPTNPLFETSGKKAGLNEPDTDNLGRSNAGV